METPAHFEALLSDLEKRDIKLRVEGERLRYSAPAGALTPELRDRLQAHKRGLIAFLKGRQERTATYPPSFAQRRFWTLQQINPLDAFYNVPFAFRICGELDVSILLRSFNEIVDRHEVLRTTLQVLDGELMQVVAPAGAMNFAVVDLEDHAPEIQAGAVNRLLRAEIERPFDLAQEAGLRASLLRLANHEHILLLCFHNTLYDQSSLIVLLGELSARYAALHTGSSQPLPQPAQYREYQRWQESLLTTRMGERLSFWRRWFAGGEPPLWTWTPGKPPPAVPSFHSHVSWIHCTPELTEQLKALSQRCGATPYMTLIAAYSIILRRYTDCEDVTIGTTYSNRHHWRFESLIGATFDVPALRIDMTGNPELSALVSQVRAVVAAALTWQDVPFERIAPDLQLECQPRMPLFRVVFSFFPETPHGRLQFPGSTVTFLEEAINDLSRPELYLVLWEKQTAEGASLTGYWMHKQDTFGAGTAARMNQEFQALLAAMVSHPAGTVNALLESVEIGPQ